MATKQRLLEAWRAHKLISNQRLLDAFEFVPREKFIPPHMINEAYRDHPLPTLRNQSISQPTTIMMMLQLLELKEGHTVLEIGAGVGYQAALLSHVVGDCGNVITIDIIPELVAAAHKNIINLGITNTTVLEQDGGLGYTKAGLFDRIIITAACPAIPSPLIEQMKEGGIVLAPVGDMNNQTLVRGIKVGSRLDLDFFGQFRFVPLRGKHGFEG